MSTPPVAIFFDPVSPQTRRAHATKTVALGNFHRDFSMDASLGVCTLHAVQKITMETSKETSSRKVVLSC